MRQPWINKVFYLSNASPNIATSRVVAAEFSLLASGQTSFNFFSRSDVLHYASEKI